MDIFLEHGIEDVRAVDPNRDYWFIRSYGGELFDTFFNNSFVGLGLNNVPYKLILDSADPKKDAFKDLQRFIDNNTEYTKGEATKWANQLLNFEYGVKINDIVITPSRNSDILAIGIVESNTYLDKNPGAFKFNGRYEALPEKRKKVNWIKTFKKEVLQAEIRGLLSSHQAVTNARSYSEIIEGNLSSVYIKGERIYLTIQINQDEDINAFELNRFLSSLTFFYDEFCKENGFKNNEDLYIKIKLQSRGKMALQAGAIGAIMGIAGLMVLSNNNELSVEIENVGKVSGKGDGFLESVSDFLDRNQERQIKYEIFKDSMERLKVKPIEETTIQTSTPVDTTYQKNN
ncbi:hypothetical protein [Pontibacter burrus]|uniref:Uncharacterized protein n=1 Tax=Pontibacter burrus TaxID=2704466 RepID=A0A6B3LK94_9BACT|nr:hypothetical protein [Pontibacter burrus]NEM97199.1 hypothetical protein [Pontibacter burrus]